MSQTKLTKHACVPVPYSYHSGTEYAKDMQHCYSKTSCVSSLLPDCSCLSYSSATAEGDTWKTEMARLSETGDHFCSWTELCAETDPAARLEPEHLCNFIAKTFRQYLRGTGNTGSCTHWPMQFKCFPSKMCRQRNVPFSIFE